MNARPYISPERLHRAVPGYYLPDGERLPRCRPSRSGLLSGTLSPFRDVVLYIVVPFLVGSLIVEGLPL